MRIGLIGGSFDPIHSGHLVLAEQVREKLTLDQVVFIPSGNPPHKSKDAMTANAHRFAMVQAAIADNAYFRVSDVEMDPSHVHYTVNTIKRLKALEQGENDYFFIAGADALLDVEKWRSCEELLSLCTFVGATRPGFDLSVLQEEVLHLTQTYGQPIELIEISAFDISASEIRERLFQGYSVRYMVPETVWTYIQTHGLYRLPKEETYD